MRLQALGGYRSTIDLWWWLDTILSLNISYSRRLRSGHTKPIILDFKVCAHDLQPQSMFRAYYALLSWFLVAWFYLIPRVFILVSRLGCASFVLDWPNFVLFSYRSFLYSSGFWWPIVVISLKLVHKCTFLAYWCLVSL